MIENDVKNANWRNAWSFEKKGNRDDDPGCIYITAWEDMKISEIEYVVLLPCWKPKNGERQSVGFNTARSHIDLYKNKGYRAFLILSKSKPVVDCKHKIESVSSDTPECELIEQSENLVIARLVNSR